MQNWAGSYEFQGSLTTPGSMQQLQELIARSALTREESRGAHYRQDFPEQDPRWLKNIRVKPGSNGSAEFSTIPVQFTRLAPPASMTTPAVPVSEPAGAGAKA